MPSSGAAFSMERAMKLRLVRQLSGERSTLGELFIDGEAVCRTLENPWKDNRRRVSCIPEGTYEIKFRTVGGWQKKARKKFPDMHNAIRGMLELQDVPGRDYILIHWGNHPHDTLGCILVGLTHDTDYVGPSVPAYREIYPRIAEHLGCGRRVTITIEGPQIS